MLNLPDAVAATRESVFGRVGDDDFGMDDVKCVGNETDIRNGSTKTEDCDGDEAAGPDTFPPPRGQTVQ